MKKILISTALSLLSTPAFSHPGISLEEGIQFNGKCGAITIKGKAFPSIGNYFAPSNVEASLLDEVVFSSDDYSLPIGIDHMSVNCLGEAEDQRLLIGVTCAANASACGKTWFYIIDAKTGTLIAPTDKNSEKLLCDADCADKLIDGGFAKAIEKERYN